MVEERELGRSGHAPTTGHAGTSRVGRVELEQRVVGDLAQRELAHSEHGLELVGGRRLTDGAERGDAVLLVEREAETQAGEAERKRDAFVNERAVVLPGLALDELGQHPMG